MFRTISKCRYHHALSYLSIILDLFVIVGMGGPPGQTLPERSDSIAEPRTSSRDPCRSRHLSFFFNPTGNLEEMFLSDFSRFSRRISDIGNFQPSLLILTERSEILTEVSLPDSPSDRKREGVYFEVLGR